jgi:hypothetical protein
VFDESVPAYPFGHKVDDTDDDLAPWLARLPEHQRVAAIGYSSPRASQRRRGAGAEARRQERRRERESGRPWGLLPRKPDRGKVAG